MVFPHLVIMVHVVLPHATSSIEHGEPLGLRPLHVAEDLGDVLDVSVTLVVVTSHSLGHDGTAHGEPGERSREVTGGQRKSVQTKG